MDKVEDKSPGGLGGGQNSGQKLGNIYLEPKEKVENIIIKNVLELRS